MHCSCLIIAKSACLKSNIFFGAILDKGNLDSKNVYHLKIFEKTELRHSQDNTIAHCRSFIFQKQTVKIRQFPNSTYPQAQLPCRRVSACPELL